MKILITSKKFERITIRPRKNRKVLMCEICDEASVMLSPEETCLVSGIGIFNLADLLKNGEIHYVEYPSGLLLICIESLQKVQRKLEL